MPVLQKFVDNAKNFRKKINPEGVRREEEEQAKIQRMASDINEYLREERAQLKVLSKKQLIDRVLKLMFYIIKFDPKLANKL